VALFIWGCRLTSVLGVDYDIRTVAKLFAQHLIIRPDVKAFQRDNGAWYPEHSKIEMTDLLRHLDGNSSMGHYTVSPEGMTKFFAFDIDLEEAKPDRGIWYPMPVQCNCTPEEVCSWDDFENADPRGEWKSGAMTTCTERFLIYQLRTMAHLLADTTEQTLGVRTAVAYSGSKGVHVYALTGPISAADARAGAQIVLDQTNRFELLRGQNFFKHRAIHDDPILDMPQLSVEVFPKQDSVEGKAEKLGNLMRLPLGWNRNTPAGITHHRPQFLDVRHRMTEFKERNPVEALTIDSQWAGAIN
jgi:hypothetical protein